MGKPQWVTDERVDKLQNSFDLIPSIVKDSHRDFRQPPTLEDDFKRLLEHDIPHANYNFEVIHDWYLAQDPDCEPLIIRAQMTPIDWKSKIGNSDMSTNFKTTYEHKIQKGDIVVRQDGKIYMLNWNVTEHPNNQASQNIELNDKLTFVREHIQRTDEYGFAIDDDDDVQLDENGMQIVCEDMPVSHSQYNGRPEYSIAQAQPGVTANHLVNMYVQWNCKTKDIRINDMVKIHQYMYSVHNVFDGQVDINGEYGCLYIQLRRLPGGEMNGKYNRY